MEENAAFSVEVESDRPLLVQGNRTEQYGELDSFWSPLVLRRRYSFESLFLSVFPQLPSITIILTLNTAIELDILMKMAGGTTVLSSANFSALVRENSSRVLNRSGVLHILLHSYKDEANGEKTVKMVHIIENPPIPLSTPIYEGMKAHSSVEIHGEVYQGPQGGFTVEFPTKNGVALHISVRMGMYGQNVIVFNHLDHGRWHREEHHHNHVHFGKPFCMKIHNEHKKYSIHVDGHHIGHYHHHKCPKKIVAMTVRGDIRVGKIHFENFKHHNGGGVEVGLVAPVAPVAPTPMVVAPPPVMVPPPQLIMAPAPAVVQPMVQPMYPNIQPMVYPTATPVIYTQPEVIYMEGYHRHHHHC